MPRKKSSKPKKAKKEKVVEIVEEVVEEKVKIVEEPVGPYDHYSVELIHAGPLSGEYRFRVKGTTTGGWQVTGRDLDDAYRTAEATPAALRS